MNEVDQYLAGGLVDPMPMDRLKSELCKLPQYQPETKHYFHAGMYCREVFRHAGVALVGKVHKKEHFYVVASGTIILNGGRHITGPAVLECTPGTQRAVYSVTDAVCMTFHITDAKTVEEAEKELVEDDPMSMYGPGNMLKALEAS